MSDKVLVTFIQSNTLVASNRYTLKEMLMASAGYMPDTQQHSKNFFEVRTFLADPRQPDHAHLTFEAKLVGLEFTKSYYHFRIPKHSGGTRQIKAPEENLKELQKDIADDILHKLKVLPHNAAYAYTRGRCAYDAMVTHQKANARWFLKIDVKDFFPSITTDVLRRTLPKVFPFNNLDTLALEKLIDLATDEDSLPQGSPLSPILSNLILVEFDRLLYIKLKRFNHQSYTYTRYADDMLITCPYTFKYQDIIDIITSLFKELELPFTLSPQKVRYASMSGRNWNLGLMYTDQQRITVGSKKKKELHSLVNSFVCEYPNWDVSSTQELQGKLAYLNTIEPDYYNTLVNKYNMKYNVSVPNLIRDILTGNIVPAPTI